MQRDALAPHTARNCGPILRVLRDELSCRRQVLEIGSGNGQHATIIAAALPRLCWQTSDLEANHRAIRDWLRSAAVANVREPIVLNVLRDRVEPETYDAAFSANTAHIMSQPAVQAMFDVVARALRAGGLFCLYGPFREHGNFSSESNARFDASLRAQDPQMGVRDLDDLDRFADAGDLRRKRLYAMPANNYLAVWRKRGDGK